jgi:hypothetical protein
VKADGAIWRCHGRNSLRAACESPASAKILAGLAGNIAAILPRALPQELRLVND